MVLASSSSSPSPIASSFRKLVAGVQLTDRDRQLFQSHRTSVSGALEARLASNRLSVIGSFQRDSAIHLASDIDLLLVLERGAVTWGDGLKSSDTVLESVRNALMDRFALSRIGRDRQAVVIDFNDGAHPVDVVPGVYDRNDGRYNHPVFLIPDGSGGWMETSPSSHGKYINDADERSGGKLKYTAQLFKFWRATRQAAVPVSGFYAEMLLAAEGICEGARTYSEVFRELLVVLSNRDCDPFPDPTGICETIEPTTTVAKLEQACRTIHEAAGHADAALEAEHRENWREARRQWDIAFNGRFPA